MLHLTRALYLCPPVIPLHFHTQSPLTTNFELYFHATVGIKHMCKLVIVCLKLQLFHTMPHALIVYSCDFCVARFDDQLEAARHEQM